MVEGPWKTQMSYQYRGLVPLMKKMSRCHRQSRSRRCVETKKSSREKWDKNCENLKVEMEIEKFENSEIVTTWKLRLIYKSSRTVNWNFWKFYEHSLNISSCEDGGITWNISRWNNFKEGEVRNNRKTIHEKVTR